MTREKRWAVVTAPDATAHIVPQVDAFEHAADDDCACGPTVAPVPRDDGSMGWVITHHSLDGREADE